MTLAELRHDLLHMDSGELLAFGRLHRVNPDSVEYQEAQAEWQRRQSNQKDTTLKPPVDTPDFAEMAEAAGPGRYPWVRYPE